MSKWLCHKNTWYHSYEALLLLAGLILLSNDSILAWYHNMVCNISTVPTIASLITMCMKEVHQGPDLLFWVPCCIGSVDMRRKQKFSAAVRSTAEFLTRLWWCCHLRCEEWLAPAKGELGPQMQTSHHILKLSFPHKFPWKMAAELWCHPFRHHLVCAVAKSEVWNFCCLNPNPRFRHTGLAKTKVDQNLA